MHARLQATEALGIEHAGPGARLVSSFCTHGGSTSACPPPRAATCRVLGTCRSRVRFRLRTAGLLLSRWEPEVLDDFSYPIHEAQGLGRPPPPVAPPSQYVNRV